MIYYHTTDAVDAILRDGFRDDNGSYGLVHTDPDTGQRKRVKLEGVWLSDMPLDANEGTRDGQVLRVEFPDDIDLSVEGVELVESVEEHKSYREWNVSAALINENATVTLMTDDEVDELARQRLLERLGKDEWLQRRLDQLPPPTWHSETNG